jgi:hypothetical protein
VGVPPFELPRTPTRGAAWRCRGSLPGRASSALESVLNLFPIFDLNLAAPRSGADRCCPGGARRVAPRHPLESRVAVSRKPRRSRCWVPRCPPAASPSTARGRLSAAQWRRPSDRRIERGREPSTTRRRRDAVDCSQQRRLSDGRGAAASSGSGIDVASRRDVDACGLRSIGRS